MKSKNWQKKEKFPFVVYADFEALNMKMNSQKGKMHTYQKHHPCGFCLQIVCGFDEKVVFLPVLYRAKSENEDVARSSLKLWKQKSKNFGGNSMVEQR